MVTVTQAQQRTHTTQPKEHTVTVRRGDTLSGIAQDHNVSLQDVLRANPQVRNPNLIYPGQHITIPQGTPAPRSAPSHAAPEPAAQRQPRATQDPRRRHAPPPADVNRQSLEARLPQHATPAQPQASQAHGAVGPKPHGMAQKAEWYRNVVQQAGGKWRTGTNEVNIVGLRGQDVNGQRNHNAFNQWNDTMAYVWKDSHGKMQVREFRATTDPGQKYGDGRDVNRDGVLDIAHLRPGSYAYRLGTHHGQSGAGNPLKNLPVDRDTNHDGKISAAERAASKRRGDVGYGINIHWGDGATVGGWSLGCQVIKGSREHFLSHVTPIMQLNRGQMYYTLVDRSR